MKQLSTIQIEGLPGPTHHFGGWANGNVASMMNQSSISHPKRAALECLNKAKLILDLGCDVFIAGPHLRPYPPYLNILGDQLNDPLLISFLSNSAFMWTANMAHATINSDHITHVTVANMSHTPHRIMESKFNQNYLELLFQDCKHVKVHPPCPSPFGDEGAANHAFIHDNYSGLDLFVYGKKKASIGQFQKFPRRQDRIASESIARCHQVQFPLFCEQNQDAIDQGVFHNDVSFLSENNTVVCHEYTFENTNSIQIIQDEFFKRTQKELQTFLIHQTQLSLKELVQSYICNGQLIPTPQSYLNSIQNEHLSLKTHQKKHDATLSKLRKKKNSLIWILSEDYQSVRSAKQIVNEIINANIGIESIITVPLSESMKNGGGPACCRLRIPIQESEIDQLHRGLRLTQKKYNQLKNWIEAQYPETLNVSELMDTNFQTKSRRIVAAFYEITNTTKLLDLMF